MKKILLTAIIACFGFGVASAQDPGQWAVGPRLNIYTNAGAQGALLGIGAVGRYSFNEHWRVEPAITALCHRGCSFDFNADVHYRFDLTQEWAVYPAVGLSANDIGSWSCGINIGAGTDLVVTDRWDVTAGVKWMLQTADFHRNPIVVTVGAVYKF